jgi:hypothetical protein
MATYSTLSVINYSLVLCGANTVSSITDDTPNARALNIVHDFCRKGFLTDNKWSFSTTRTTLVTVSSTAITWLHGDESYVYTRPTNCLRIFEVNNCNVVWREEGDYIISNTPDLGIKWAFDQTDYTKWQPSAVEAMCYKLASEIAFQIMNSATKAEALKKYYDDQKLVDAMAKNSQTGTQQSVQDDDWLNQKWGTSGGDPSRSYS